MALLWKKVHSGTRYEVRSAGHSLRLYTNGVFHSQFNDLSPLAGSVWDLLCLPGLFYSPGAIQRVLVLGVGGGAVIRQLNALLHPKEIIAVELDPVHVQIAKRFFDLKNAKNLKLIQGDAVQWLKHHRNEKFDLVIEDLFGENNGEPNRAVTANKSWCNRLLNAVASHGVLAMNFESSHQLGQSAMRSEPNIQQHYRSAFSLKVPGYDNCIGAFFKTDKKQSDYQQQLRALQGRMGKGATNRLTAKVRKLS